MTSSISKEKESLKKLPSTVYAYEFLQNDSELYVQIKSKEVGTIKLWILLPQNYPFEIPQIKMEFEVIIKKKIYFYDFIGQRHIFER